MNFIMKTSIECMQNVHSNFKPEAISRDVKCTRNYQQKMHMKESRFLSKNIKKQAMNKKRNKWIQMRMRMRMDLIYGKVLLSI